MVEGTWTPTGELRWFEKVSGEVVLQQRLEKVGYSPIWFSVPTVREFDPKNEISILATKIVSRLECLSLRLRDNHEAALKQVTNVLEASELLAKK